MDFKFFKSPFWDFLSNSEGNLSEFHKVVEASMELYLIVSDFNCNFSRHLLCFVLQEDLQGTVVASNMHINRIILYTSVVVYYVI